MPSTAVWVGVDKPNLWVICRAELCDMMLSMNTYSTKNTDTPDVKSTSTPPSTTQTVLNSWWTLVVAILVMGPFALPLLWRNPRAEKSTKIWVSVLVIGGTVTLVIYTINIGSRVFEQLQQLQHLNQGY